TRFSRDWSSDVCSSDLSGFDLDYRFWARHSKGEIDLLLEFEDTLVGIEVKYRSGISSEDSGEIVSYDQSLHQLSKYSHMMESLRSEERRVGKECRTGWE